MNTIDVVGCNGRVFSSEGMAALAEAKVVVGSPRLLEDTDLPAGAEKVVLGGNVIGMLPGLVARGKKEKMAILASGDPLYCGIGATLQRFVPAGRLRFFPAVTAFQQLFAALGQPWERALLYSLHARKDELPYCRLLRSPLTAIYGDGGRPARRIARELIEAFPAAATRQAAVGCNLGFADGTVLRGTLRELAERADADASLSVLALLPDSDAVYPELPLGLPDHCYDHFKNMITHPEVRAVALAKLRLVPGVMWDLGAGSGSVGLEAAGLCPELAVHAVEKDPGRAGQLAANLAAEGLPNIRCYCGEANAMLAKLPDPDRIFIGGGGRELLETAFGRLRPGGVLVMTGVMLDSINLMSSALTAFRREFLTLQVSRAEELTPQNFMLRAENPIAVAVWAKPKGESRS